MKRKKQKNELDNHLKLLAKSSFFVLMSLIFSKIFMYFYRILIARTYGPEVYGLFSLCLIILGVSGSISTIGLSTGIKRFIPFYNGKKESHKSRYVLNISLILVMLLGTLMGLIIFLFSDTIALNIFNMEQLSPYLKLFSFSIPFFSLFCILTSALLSEEKIGWNILIVNILDSLIKVILLIFLIIIGVNHFSVPLSYVLSIFVLFFISYIVVRNKTDLFESIRKKVFSKKKTKKSFKKISKTKKKAILSNLLSYSWPLLFFGLISSVFHWTDTFLLGFFTTATDVGIYNVAVPIALILTLPRDLFIQLFLPIISKQYSKKNKKNVEQLSKQISKWIFILILPLFISFIFFPEIIIKLLFGSEFLMAKNSLRYLSIGALFLTIPQISKELISMMGKSKTILSDIIIALIINIILNCLLIPRYGIEGAAISTAISTMFLGIMFFFQSWRYLKIIPLKRKMANIFLIAIVSTIFLFILRNLFYTNLLTLIIIGFLFLGFYSLLIILNALDDKDKMILNAIKTKFFK